MGAHGGKYLEEHPFITHICHLLSLCTPKPSFPSLQAIHFVRIRIGVYVDGVVQMVKARTAAAASSPDGMAKLEYIVFEECEPFTIDQYRQIQNVIGQNNI
jgi:hypothetical protein